MLTIDPKLNHPKQIAERLLRVLLEGESAFTIRMETQTVNVGFRKGQWSIAKFDKDGTFRDEVIVSDAPSMDGSELAVGIFSALVEKDKGEYDARRTPVNALIPFLGIWSKFSKERVNFIVRKADRNSWANDDGTFSFSD